MADLHDYASEVEHQLREKNIAAVREANCAGDTDREDCEDCGAPIGEDRKQAKPNATRCIYCQTVHERRCR
jgi:phage/conjugal plasmid C-4 type zinc finger TraR family protein